MTSSVELYACVYAKEFSAQAMLRLRPQLREKPCVVMDGEPPLQYVCSRNKKAHRLGIANCMTRVEIETFPTVTVLLRSQREEASAKAAVLECAGTFSPRVEEQRDDRAFLCVADIAGTEKLFGSPAALAKSLKERVRALGIAASIAISSNFHAAVCLARGRAPGTQPAVVPTGEESAALAALRPTVLDLSEEQAQTFSLWGIYTLGMLAELPEKALIARMGQEGNHLRQLARGERPHLFLPVEPDFTLEEHLQLDTAIELLEPLLFFLSAMLEQLIVRATAHILALSSVTITLIFEGGSTHTRTVQPALPSNDRQLWIKLFHLDLEAHPPQAAILSLKLTAEPGSTSKVQLGLFSPQLPEPARLDVTLARIRAIVGEDCVGRPVLKDTHQLEGFSIEPFVVSRGKEIEPASRQQRAAMRWLRPAENLTVMLREQQPEAFYFQTTRYAVERAFGPWRVSGEWWAPAAWGLEQWDLTARSVDGSLLHCCLTHDLTQGGWQMVALYD